MREALLYQKLEEDRVRCDLCAHRCQIGPGKRGICRVRENRGGILYSLVYGRLVAANVDPIEKKPLFHFQPSSTSFSVATVGCNFQCPFCQNHNLSQAPVKGDVGGSFLPPEDLVVLAQRYGCKSISYTYTEPTIFLEYAYDTARLAHRVGIKNIFVTNGYLTEEALDLMGPYLDGANVDLKGFQDAIYKRVMKARLGPVLDCLKSLKRRGIWVEVTTLVVPTLNDSEDELKEIAEFVRSLGEETPWHVSRFHPHFRMAHLPPTPLKALNRAWEIGREAGLRYVYSGNVPGDKGESTYCYGCGRLLIRRYGFSILEYNLKEGRCPSCGAQIDGVGMEEGVRLPQPWRIFG